jgi:formylglycine-generating enzyme required for sulfatase activity
MTVALQPNFARIPAGGFLMGSSDGEAGERPVHRVYVGEFFIGRFPVTHDEYARFVRATGHRAPAVRSLPSVTAGGQEAGFRELAAPYEWRHGEPPPRHSTHPVVLVTFDDAAAYCRWLSDSLGRVVRLPTEAEWEKAARGGADGRRYPWGDDFDPSRANVLRNGAPKHQHGTRPTGTYAPNEYGLYDMAGNVWEWVSDWYDAGYHGAADARDPAGPPSGTMRIVRGGSWVTDDPGMLRCAYRHQVPPDTYAYSIGFRVVCPAV